MDLSTYVLKHDNNIISNETCSICLEQVLSENVRLVCKHVYHIDSTQALDASNVVVFDPVRQPRSMYLVCLYICRSGRRPGRGTPRPVSPTTWPGCAPPRTPACPSTTARQTCN